MCDCEFCKTVGRELTQREHNLCSAYPTMLDTLTRNEQKRHRAGIKPIPSRQPKRQATRKPCTPCQKRKAAMNKVIPRSGDIVEKFTEATGIKKWWEERHQD